MPEWLDALKKMKKASGCTIKEISLATGIPEPTLEKIFAGATKDPRLSTVSQLFLFFGYPLDECMIPDLREFAGSSHSKLPSFASRIREARKRKQLTQVQLSQLIGVAKTTLTGYEKGYREPDMAKIRRLAEVLDVSCDWLLGRIMFDEEHYSVREKEIVARYRLLDRRCQQTVDDVLDSQYRVVVVEETDSFPAGNRGK